MIVEAAQQGGKVSRVHGNGKAGRDTDKKAHEPK
jgi:hypothetical protein